MGLTQITTGGVDDNINIDSNTLKVDGTNNRVGIGTAAPESTLCFMLLVQIHLPVAQLLPRTPKAGGF